MYAPFFSTNFRIRFG